MKFNQVLQQLSNDEAIALASIVANKNNCQWNKNIETVFKACCDNPSLAPKIGGNKDDERKVIAKWIAKYWNGYNNRISNRISNPPSTVADPIIETIIGTKLLHLKDKELTKITDAHRLSMSAENILGLFLEEYLHNNLIEYGWHFAWGETIRSVDFCHEDGRLLQIKNRSNSENSSSSQVRVGTTIEKWHRVDARTGNYLWQSLNDKYSTDKFSEDNFRIFIVDNIKQNPAVLAVEKNNLWLEEKSDS